jgi:BlaI family penicillinase repressor
MAAEPPKPTDAELEILTALWSIGSGTVRDIHTLINRRRPAEYSTLLKFMQIMTEKGLVEVDQSQRAHVYTSAKPREFTQRQLAGDLLQRVFSGSAKGLFVGALSSGKTSKKELAELRKLLDEYQEAKK